jgi:hypothetical protein
VALPKSEGHTGIMVVIDCFSKVAHFIALAETATTKDAATAFLKEVWKLHGLLECEGGRSYLDVSPLDNLMVLFLQKRRKVGMIIVNTNI